MDPAKLKAVIDDQEGDWWSTKTDAEIADALNAETITETYQRFASYRTLAGLLTDEQYATVKTTMGQLASQSPRVADMDDMLKLPGDEGGNGGGIDFGSLAVRGMVDAYFSDPIKTILLGISERQTSIAKQQSLGFVGDQQVARVRLDLVGA